MNKYLLEIGVEELPARFVEMAVEQLRYKSKKVLEEALIDFKDVIVYATPRRLTLIVDDIAASQKDIHKEVKGPSVKIAYDEENNPTKPLLGFMKSQNIELEDLFNREVKGQEYVFANINSIGKDTRELLKEIMPALIRDINFPKNMRWGGKNIRFARPIRWIMSIFNDEVVEFPLEAIPVSNITRGHRFLGSSNILVKNVDEYEKLLEENYVIVDQKKRRNIIEFESKKLAKSLGGEIREDKALLEELTYIVEYPTPIRGSIKEEYLILPDEVITTTMIDHLRYIPVYNDKKELLPYFITIRNGNSDYKEIVISGNERVLGARLEDAKFFYEDDISKPLDEYVKELKGLMFQDKLGNMYDKQNRNKVLANKIGLDLEVADETIKSLDRAIDISKADLVTKMVVEFTELQGVMGSIYAKLQGEKELVSQSIYEQYLPRNAEDELPKSTAGSILSMADKIDTISGLFAIGLIPTGSQDPFGLRRSCIGIINIIKNNNWEIYLDKIVGDALYEYVNSLGLTFDFESVKDSVIDFFKKRLKNMLEDLGYRYDIIDALINSDDKIHIVFKKAEELDKWFKEENRNEFVDAFTRINNLISNNSKDVKVSRDLFEKDIEEELYNKFLDIKSKNSDLLDKNNYTFAMDNLNILVEYIAKYFEDVMIMSNKEEVKENRLKMLSEIEEEVQKILSIEKIVTD